MNELISIPTRKKKEKITEDFFNIAYMENSMKDIEFHDKK